MSGTATSGGKTTAGGAATAGGASTPGETPAISPASAGGASVAGRVAALYAIDPVGLGGVLLHGLPSPVRDNWIALLKGLPACGNAGSPCAGPCRQ